MAVLSAVSYPIWPLELPSAKRTYADLGAAAGDLYDITDDRATGKWTDTAWGVADQNENLEGLALVLFAAELH
jgi:hypothetical protein